MVQFKAVFNKEEEEEKRKRKKQMDQAMVLMQNLLWQSLVMDSQGAVEIDHRLLPRNKRTKYDHERALYCIMSDYLSLVSCFDGREFQQMFRLSRS